MRIWGQGGALVVYNLHRRPLGRAGASYFFLDEKVTKNRAERAHEHLQSKTTLRINQDKKMLPPTGHTPRPAFLSGQRTFVLEIITTFALY